MLLGKWILVSEFCHPFLRSMSINTHASPFLYSGTTAAHCGTGWYVSLTLIYSFDLMGANHSSLVVVKVDMELAALLRMNSSIGHAQVWGRIKADDQWGGKSKPRNNSTDGSFVTCTIGIRSSCDLFYVCTPTPQTG